MKKKIVVVATTFVLLGLIALTIFGIVVLLARAEANASVRLIEPPRILNSCSQWLSQKGIFILKPNCIEETRIGGREIKMSFDAQGLRSIVGPQSGHRILVLGGSVLMGNGLPDNQDDPVKKWAQETMQSLPNLRWINASVRGYTTVHIANQFRQRMQEFSPEVVVIDSLRGPRIFQDYARRSRIEMDPSGFPERVRDFGSGRSFLIQQLLKSSSFEPVVFSLLYYSELLEAAREISLLPDRKKQIEALLAPDIQMLQRMQEEALRMGTQFYVLLDGSEATQDLVHVKSFQFLARPFIKLMPVALSVAPSEIADELKTKGINFISLSPDYQKAIASEPERYLLEDSYHLSESGAALFGKYANLAFGQEFLKLNKFQRH